MNWPNGDLRPSRALLSLFWVLVRRSRRSSISQLPPANACPSWKPSPVATSAAARAEAGGAPAIPDPTRRATIVGALGQASQEAATAVDLAGLVSLKDQRGGNRNLSGLGVAVRLKEFDLGFNPLEDERLMGVLPVLTVAGWDDKELLRGPADPAVRVEQGFSVALPVHWLAGSSRNEAEGRARALAIRGLSHAFILCGQALLQRPNRDPAGARESKADTVRPVRGGRPRPFQLSKQCPSKRPRTSNNTRPLHFSSSADRSIPCTAQLHCGCGRGVRDGTHARFRKVCSGDGSPALRAFL